MEAAVIGSGPDERKRHASNLCSDSNVSFSLTVCAGRITPHVAFVLGPETVFTHANGNARGHPKDGAESRIASFRKSREATELSRLFGGEIESAEL